jgi:hypothetical protein
MLRPGSRLRGLGGLLLALYGTTFSVGGSSIVTIGALDRTTAAGPKWKEITAGAALTAIGAAGIVGGVILLKRAPTRIARVRRLVGPQPCCAQTL